MKAQSSLWRATREMHEWPLVVLTSLAIPAAGIFAARFLASAVFGSGQPGTGPETFAALALLVGLVVSLAHLGRPARAPLALRRTGRSMLSTEAALASALLVVAVLGLLPSVTGALRDACVTAAGVLGLGLLLTFGLVYFLPGCWPWRTALVAAPMSSGLAAGTLVLACAPAPPLPLLAPLVALAVDTGVFAAAWTSQHNPAEAGSHGAESDPHRNPAEAGSHIVEPALAPVHPAVFARRRALVSLRVVLVDLAPATLLLAQLPAIALVFLLVGLVVDRVAFYGLAAMRSTEAEMAGIERVIAQE